MRLSFFLRVLLSMFANAAEISYSKNVERVWDLSNMYNTALGISWGLNHERIYNKERMWVKYGDTIQIWNVNDLPDSIPTMERQMATQSACLQSFTYLMKGNKFMSLHGNDQYCTCTRTPDNPCPHKVQITVAAGPDIDYAGKYEFFGNTNRHVESETPDVIGTYAIADPLNACGILNNPKDIEGQYCIVYRGGCEFQTKWNYCDAAGAIGTIVVMRDNQSGAGFMMWVDDVNTPMVGIHRDLGDKLKATYESGRRNVLISVGRGIGADAPDSNYTEADPLTVINYYTGVRSEDTASHFTTSWGLLYNDKTDWVHVLGVNGNDTENQVYDFDHTPPLYKGSYNTGVNGAYGFLYYPEDDSNNRPQLVMWADGWDDVVNFFDMTDVDGNIDELNPQLIQQVTYPRCVSARDRLGFVVMHPSQNYMYLVPGIHTMARVCSYEVRIFDLHDLNDIQFIGVVKIPEVNEGSNIFGWFWGDGNIAALTLSSNGVAWYDFTIPVNPTPVAHIDFNEIFGTYTLGARRAIQMSDGETWVIEDESETSNNFHAFKLVEKTLSKTCHEDDSSWMAIGIIFIIWTLIASAGAYYFYRAYHSQTAFKFSHFEDPDDLPPSPSSQSGKEMVSIPPMPLNHTPQKIPMSDPELDTCEDPEAVP